MESIKARRRSSLLRKRYSKAIAVAKELFPGKIEIEQCPDPEFPESSAIVVTVTASGDPAEFVRRRREWYRKTRKLAYHDLRLSIVPSA